MPADSHTCGGGGHAKKGAADAVAADNADAKKSVCGL